jgi:hypothetical protein
MIMNDSYGFLECDAVLFGTQIPKIQSNQLKSTNQGDPHSIVFSKTGYLEKKIHTCGF